MEIDPDEYEWLVLSEKTFRMIALVHECTQDVVGRPIWFKAKPDPVAKTVKFKVKYRSVTYEYKVFKFTMSVEDWTPDEITGRVALAYHSAEIHTPGSEL